LHINPNAAIPHIDKILYPIVVAAATEKKEFVAKNP